MITRQASVSGEISINLDRRRHTHHQNRRMSIIRQAFCTLIVCFTALNVGLMFAWPSSTIKLFSSTNTTLNRPMTETEISLFGSLTSIGAVVGTPLSGLLIDRLGRKYSCLLFALPQPIAWALISTIPRVEVILASLFLSGIGGCIFMVGTNIISEFCQETIRGTMSSGVIIFYGIGLMVSYVLGGQLSYHVMNYVCLVISVLFTLLLTIIKESPVYLMQKGLEEEAAKSIAFYRSTTPNSKRVLQEMAVIRRSLNPKLDETTLEEEKLNIESVTPKNLSFIQFFKKSYSTRQGFIVVLVIYFATIFQGLVVIQVYSEPLFASAIPSMSANLSSIMFALMNTVAGFFSAYLLDYFGRRPVLIYASIATTFSCIAQGTQIQIHWGPHWLTAVFLYVYCVTCTMGAGTVPYVLVPEMFLPEVRGIMSMLIVEWAWICNATILYVYNPLNAAIGLGPVFYMFGIFSVISSIYSYLYLPETKGLTVDVIQTLLEKKKKSLNT